MNKAEAEAFIKQALENRDGPPVKIITVTYYKGIVDSVEGIPKGYEVHFHDYDGEADESHQNVEKDEDGDLYWHSIFESEEK